MPKILIGVNTLTVVEQAVYLSHCNLWYRIGRDFPYPEWKFIFYPPRRAGIDRMRNECAKIAMEAECSHVLFIDDDVLVQPNTLNSLLAANADIAMAETYIRGYPFEPMFFKHDKKTKKLEPYRDFKKHVDPETGLVEVDAIGTSCALISVELFKKIPPPYFVTMPEHFYNALGVCTEDVFFCMKARQVLSDDKVRMVVDTKVPTGHLLDREPVSGDNRVALQVFAETAYPSMFKKENKSNVRTKGDRQKEYYQENIPQRNAKKRKTA